MKSIVLLAILLSGLTGCASPSIANRYAPLADNVSALRAMPVGQVSVGQFSQSEDIPKEGLECLFQVISPPDGMSFSKYFESALIAELKMAEKYSPTARNRIDGNLSSITVEPSLINANAIWYISINLSANGASMPVSEKFTVPFSGTDICITATQRLGDAVQNLLNKAISAPEFKVMIGG